MNYKIRPEPISKGVKKELPHHFFSDNIFDFQLILALRGKQRDLFEIKVEPVLRCV